MKHLGIHWPNGPVNPDNLDGWGTPLLNYPGSVTVMGSESAVWWYWDIPRIRPDMTVFWRHIPLPEYRPAFLRYDARKYAHHLRDQIDRGLSLPKNKQQVPPEYIIVGNEFNLNYERGDNEDDWSNLENRYRRLNQFLVELYHEVKFIYPNSKIVYPAWSPYQRVHDHLDKWTESAKLYDVYQWHAYSGDDDGTLIEWFQWSYDFAKRLLPGKPQLCGEHHGLSVEDEIEALQWAYTKIQQDPNLLGFVRFIWKWYDGETDQWDIYNNLPMMDLYSSPSYTVPTPVNNVADPIPNIPTTGEYNPSPEYVREQCRLAADRHGIPRQLLLALSWAESSWRGNAERWGRITDQALQAINNDDLERLRQVFETVQANWPGDISFGHCQPTWRWRDADEFPNVPENDLTAILAYREKYFDVIYAADRGAKRIKAIYSRYKPDMLEALCRYNKPAIPGISNPARPRYKQALDEAEKYTKEPVMAVTDPGKVALWRLYLPTLMYEFGGGDYTGFFKHWIPDEWGSPITEEYTGSNGRPRQSFSNGIWEWTPTGPVKVL
jgi:hypothetical protein